MSKWFPEQEYHRAHTYAVRMARQRGCEVGLERFSEYGKPGFRVFRLPQEKYRAGYELRCEVVRAADPLGCIDDGI